MLKEFHDQLKTNHSYTITKNKIDRHLRDINDTISEEDINNMSMPPVFGNRIIVNNGIIEIRDQKNNDPFFINNKPEKNPNPWNIIS